jgi:hypothetical protein
MAPSWVQICSQLGSGSIICAITYGGRLYAGTAAHGNLYRLNLAGNAWEQVCAEFGTSSQILSLAEYNGKLYAGPAGGALGAGLLRLNDAGNAWQQVCPKFSTELQIVSLCAYNGKLYAGTINHADLIRLNDTNDGWVSVVGQYNASSILHVLIVYNGHLYGITNKTNGGALLRLNVTNNGWDVVCDPMYGNDNACGAAVFNGRLYIGCVKSGSAPTGACDLLKLNDAGTACDLVCPQYGAEGAIRPFVSNNRLYAGTGSLTAPGGTGLLLRLNLAGNAWEQLCSQFASETVIQAMAEYNGSLYGGTSPSGLLLKFPISTSSFSDSTVADGTYTTSFINPASLVSTIQSSSPDSYFDSTDKLGQVYVYYTHQDGRQQKRLIHNYDGAIMQAPVHWTSNARDGTWQKTSIVVYDKDGAYHELSRSVIGSTEDLDHTSGNIFLNVV